MREIKFRGKDIKGVWHYGDIIHNKKVTTTGLEQRVMVGGYEVLEDTIGQFTGLYDKSDNEVYEGDIIEFYELKSYCINPDCEPHLLVYNDRLCKKKLDVTYQDGFFCVEDEDRFLDSAVALSFCGINEWDLEDLNERKERDDYFDANGYEINNSIVGIKVIGNVFDNKELITK